MWQIFCLVMAIGWVMNIFDIFATEVASGLTLMRVVGIFLFPLGCILGFF